LHVLAPDDHRELIEDQDKPIGHQHLVEVVAFGERREHAAFNERAQHHHGENGARIGCRKGPAGKFYQMERAVGAEHEESAVGEVDDTHDAEGEREPARDEKQQHSELQPVEDLHENGAELHVAALPLTPSSPGQEAGRGSARSV
jgi:hypothetical protein